MGDGSMVEQRSVLYLIYNNNNNTFMFQRVFILLFQLNSVLLNDGFVLDNRSEH